MNLLGEDQASRRQAVQQAVANLQARGITPRPAVLALYERFVCGEWSLAQVAAVMHQRAINLLQSVPPTQPIKLEFNPVAEHVSEAVA